MRGVGWFLIFLCAMLLAGTIHAGIAGDPAWVLIVMGISTGFCLGTTFAVFTEDD